MFLFEMHSADGESSWGGHHYAGLFPPKFVAFAGKLFEIRLTESVKRSVGDTVTSVTYVEITDFRDLNER